MIKKFHGMRVAGMLYNIHAPTGINPMKDLEFAKQPYIGMFRKKFFISVLLSTTYKRNHLILISDHLSLSLSLQIAIIWFAINNLPNTI